MNPLSFSCRILQPQQTVIVEQLNHQILLSSSDIQARFDESGLLISLVYKGQSVIQDLPGNQLVLFEDVPNYWDAWDVSKLPFLVEARLNQSHL